MILQLFTLKNLLESIMAYIVINYLILNDE
jgi:hypothetical protein